jgi:preprotein translocase subunit SecG
MLGSFLTNVPAGTANLLSYTMLVVVAIFLLSGPIVSYYYWRKSKRVKAASSTGSA